MTLRITAIAIGIGGLILGIVIAENVEYVIGIAIMAVALLGAPSWYLVERDRADGWL